MTGTDNRQSGNGFRIVAVLIGLVAIGLLGYIAYESQLTGFDKFMQKYGN